ncbi:MAG: NBR1-Ig-like domain-containing protein [Anaerolineales bacterium]|nr:NBR1-Ig-like domain-containing protein [Anaerolineales bacterium]
MRKDLRCLLTVGLAGAAVSLACALPAGLVPQPAVGNTAGTAAAHTVESVMTEIAAAATGPIPLPPISTEGPSLTPPNPSAATTPVPTLSPTVAPTTIPCNRATLVSDVTVPDGSEFRPGADFTKTWRLRNNGSCTWTRDYDLLFDSGDRMSGAKSQPLLGEVRPGETVDISVDLEAPEGKGEYRGYWKLQSLGGQLFGIGDQGTKPFWVGIRVSLPDKVVYSLVENYCDADWSTASGDLPCPGEAGSPDGFVLRVEEAVMEGGRRENEPGLWTNPPAIEDGRIRGEFPAFKVEQGDAFRAVISCLDDSEQCSMKMKLEYRIGDGSVKTLDEWNEEYDDEFRSVDTDLSDLAGKKVKFILTVQTRGDFEDDTAFWLMPRIMR